MAEELKDLLEKLSVSEEESKRVFSFSRFLSNSKGHEAWVIGKVMSNEKINKEVMYRVLRSMWFTKEVVNFVELKEKVILVKLRDVDVRKRLLNLNPWLFDQNLFSLTSYVKDKEIEEYIFNLSPFWVRLYNIPFDQMDRKIVLKVGETIGEVMAIDWRDRDGGWIEYIRVKVKIDILKPLRRVVYFVGKEDAEIVCAIKYERFPAFCYKCGIVGHKTQKCILEGGQKELY
ncbi:hypothetical protein GOBAR_AA29530 [Gossypium barbadense]|uniref:CCHC-type domain-containing protein n=1 Tax=Gossypium barbadense TaxID=3634 RepID=A0A2P5WJ99_GOSBA|nr:hypothetical protein GOBAR_AA29530 [Gossypium barbadense]